MALVSSMLCSRACSHFMASAARRRSRARARAARRGRGGDGSSSGGGGSGTAGEPSPWGETTLTQSLAKNDGARIEHEVAEEDENEEAPPSYKEAATA